MRVGPDHWNAVSIDSAGVPHGGRWGYVDWFAKRLKHYGLTLCWQRSWGCFAVVRNNGGRWTWLRHCSVGGAANRPWRLGYHSLALLLYTWNTFGDQTPEMMMHYEQEAKRKQAQQKADDMERMVHDDHRRRDVERYVDVMAGRVKRVSSIPSGRILTSIKQHGRGRA
jgi:hypothetical protein